ncbi:cytochrome C [Thiofaba sp. EF100]|uniref:c-type cytochrome n=1 Tax=Thiofaba sp. EF100 TaxID=3121274 RepID=UPI0032217CDC
MTKRVLMMGVALTGMVAASVALAEPTGEMLAQTCAGCHGTRGELSQPSAFMPLAGMAEATFVKAMKDFQSGARPSTLMGPIAKGFTESEFQAMASYYAKQKK